MDNNILLTKGRIDKMAKIKQEGILQLRIDPKLKEQLIKRMIEKIWKTQDFTKKPNISAYVRELILRDLGLLKGE